MELMDKYINDYKDKFSPIEFHLLDKLKKF